MFIKEASGHFRHYDYAHSEFTGCLGHRVCAALPSLHGHAGTPRLAPGLSEISPAARDLLSLLFFVSSKTPTELINLPVPRAQGLSGSDF